MLLRVRDVAKILNVPDKTVYGWIRDGSLPAHLVHDQYVVEKTELLEWAMASKLPVSEKIFNEAENATQTTSLASAIEAGGCLYGVPGTDKASVLRYVVNAMRLPEEVDREFLYAVLLARENMCSTAIGDGVAVPHPRSPIVLHVTHPMICVCFLEQPIEFGAIDGKPVRILFTLITPTIQSHLQLLARVSYALQDAAFKAVLAQTAPEEKIIREAGRVDALVDARTT